MRTKRIISCFFIGAALFFISGCTLGDMINGTMLAVQLEKVMPMAESISSANMSMGTEDDAGKEGEVAKSAGISVAKPEKAINSLGKPSDKAGWTLYEDQENGFAISLPEAWEVMAMSEDMLGLGMSMMDQENSSFKLPDSDQFRQMVASGMKLYAINISDESYEYFLPPNLNILVFDMGQTMSLDLIERVNYGQLRQMAEKDYPVEHSRVQIDGVESIRFDSIVTYAFEMAEPQLTKLTQFLIVVDTTQYVISIGVPFDIADQYNEMIETTAQSFHLLD